ncbi:MAG: cell division FtsZ family protein [Muribaculum sp.]|nr:cell division FtsZ family protein [Muribaculum sp.]
MYNQGIEHISYVVLNTDRKAVINSPVPTKVVIGNGLGAGNKPEVAEQAAENAAEKIAEIFNDDTKMVFITAGMGGGTGTGAAPVVARIAREKGVLTIGIVTLPFLFEGVKKMLKALKGAEEMSKYVDAMLIISNQILYEKYPDLNMVNAFAKADDTLATAARSISELITSETPHIHLDFNDVDTTLRNSGAAIISTGYGEGENRMTKAITDALNSPLLKNRDILTSKHILFNIYFNPDAENPLKMEETGELTEFISGIDSDVDVIWGMAFDRTLGDTIKITILASGFDVTVDTLASKRKGSGGEVISFGPEKTADHRTSEQESHDRDRLREFYGDDAIDQMNKDKAKARYIVMQPYQMDDDSFIDALEKSPAFNRERTTAENIRNTGTRPESIRRTSVESESPRQTTSDDNAGFKIKF